MSTRACGCVYADAKNTPAIRAGHEMGGYLKKACPQHSDPMAASRNPDGTYNGVKFLAALSGIPEAEVAWTATRMQQLIRDQGRTREVAKAIVREEAKAQPWLQS